MKSRWWLLALLATGCNEVESRASLGEGAREHADEVTVALADVPANVKEAALKAVPGLTLTGAGKEREGDAFVFNILGTANGTTYEVEVSPSGTVQEIDSGGDDDHHDDDDGGRDDDDDD